MFDEMGLKPVCYREIWTIGDLDQAWLKESVKDGLFDADAHTLQVEAIKERQDHD